jgi:protein-serine/threonine kinase
MCFLIITLEANPASTGDRIPTTMAYNNQQQQQQQQDARNPNSNPNRLQLNFGFQNNPQTFSSEQARQFPTTPSTFPQPFPNAAGQQEVWGTQTPQQPGLNPQGYFNNFNPYGNQLQQGQGQGQVQTPGAASPAPNNAANNAYRSPGPGFNEVTNGFAQQMNLGGNTPRSASPYARNASPANGRPRTAGNGSQPYSSYLNAPVPGQPQQPSIYDDQVPPKNPEKYSAAITERVRHQKLLTGEFFKENVERAKTRNER